MLTFQLFGWAVREAPLQRLLTRARRGSARPVAGIFAILAGFGVAITVATAQPTEETSNGEPLGRAGVEDPASLLSVTRTEEPSPAAPAISVRGRVSDAVGNPLAGVPVVLRGNLGGIQYAAIGFPHTRDVLARTTTDGQGDFVFSNIGIPPRMIDVIDDLRHGRAGAQLLVWAEGHALQWQPIQSFRESDKHFRLLREANVSGVVVDQAGNPLDEASITAVAFSTATDNLDALHSDTGDLNLIRSEIAFHAVTDEGAFLLRNMPKDYRITMRCSSSLGHAAYFLIDTSDGAQEAVRNRNGSKGLMRVHRHPVRVIVEQQPWRRLRIVDHQGRPVAGGGVSALDVNGHYGGAAAVNGDGIAILAVKQPGVHHVYYSSDPLNPRLGLVHVVEFYREPAETVEMQLVASRTVPGQVIDGDTREPVLGVYVAASTDADDHDMPYATEAVAVSDSDGRFELPVSKGIYRFSIRHEVEGYFVPTHSARRGVEREPDLPSITVASDDLPDLVRIQVARGLQVSGAVRSQAGVPAPGVTVQAHSLGSPYRRTFAKTDSEGRFTVAGLSPYVATRIAALSELGAAEQTISAANDQPWDRSLRKTVDLKLVAGTAVAGRVVKDGKPVPGVNVRLRRASPARPNEDGVRFDLLGETTTDEMGRYRLAGLRKDDRYRLEVEPQGSAEVRDWQYQAPYSRTVNVEGGTIELPDAELKSHGQSLAGIVVDPGGNPIAGAMVSARMASGGNLSRPENGPPPWTETDSEGRFTLSYLPDEPISLLVYRPDPEGGRIRYPSYASPEMNAKGIRIVLDPALGEGVEDLDE